MATEKRLVPKAARYMHHTKSFCRDLGVTEPISILESNDREKEVTVTLMEELRRQNTFESEEESRKR
jgi:poly(A) polymerase Pap1